jgi:DNA-directed RNA polymerase specialized sigma24 family protein
MAADAIVKVLAGLKHYQHTGKFSAWLNTVARTSIADAYNKQKEDAMCPQTMERLVSSVPVQISIRLDLSAVEDVVDRMLCEQVLDGFSMTEAAARCNVSTAAARKRLRRLGNKLGSACPLLS